MLALFTGGSANAQIVNVLSKVSRESQDGVGGELTVSGAYKTGNINLRQLKGTGLGHYKAGDHLLSLILSGRHLVKGTHDAEPIKRSFEHLRYRYLSGSLVNPEAFIQAEYDEAKNLRLRALAGGGARVRLELREDLAVAAGMGAMVEREVPKGEDIELGELKGYVLRSSNYIEITYKHGDNFGLQLTAFYQPLLFEHVPEGEEPEATFGDNRRVLVEPAMQMKINGHLGMKLAYRYALNSRPFTNETTDHGFTSSLTLSF